MAEKESKKIKRGGARPGAGRPKGVPNKRTAAVVAAVESTGVTPLEFLLSVMRNPGNALGDRIDAAKAAAPYVHAKLATIEHTGPEGGPIAHTIEAVEWRIVSPAA